MPQFHIVNESTEDTLATPHSLQDALRLAREAARLGQTGDPVSVLDGGGQAVGQFFRMPDGTVAEQPIAVPTRPVVGISEPKLTAPTALDGNRHVG